MNCSQFERELFTAIENRSDPAPVVAEHARQCSNAACLSAWNDYRLLGRALADWTAAPYAVDLVSDVLNAVERDATESGNFDRTSGAPAVRPDATAGPRATPARAGIWTGAAVACAVALVMVAIMWPPREDGLTAQRAEVAPTFGPMSTAPGEPAADEDLVKLAELSVQWMNGASERVTDTVALLLPQSGDESLGSESGEPAPSRSDWRERWVPWTESFDDTWQLFWDDSMPGQSEHRMSTPVAPVT